MVIGRRGLIMGGAAGAFGGLARRRPDQQIAASESLVPTPLQIVAALQAGNVILNSKGLFVYSGPPAFGNLILSESTQPTNSLDTKGNKIVSGLSNYSVPICWNVASGGIDWYTGNFSAGWTVAPPFMNFNDITNEGVLSGFNVCGGSFASGNSSTAAPNQTNWDVAGSSSAESLVWLNPTGPTAETWHTITPNAGFTAGGQTPKYRREPLGVGGIVRLTGAVNLTANQVALTAAFNLPVNYRPTTIQHLVGQNNLSGYTPAAGSLPASIEITTAGDCLIVPAGTSGNFFNLDGLTFPLDT